VGAGAYRTVGKSSSSQGYDPNIDYESQNSRKNIEPLDHEMNYHGSRDHDNKRSYNNKNSPTKYQESNKVYSNAHQQ